MCAHATYGSGKVVAFGDSSPADDGSGDLNDNLYDGWISDANGNHERLIVNATIWLATLTSGIQEKQTNDDHIKIYLHNDGFCFSIESHSFLSGYNLDIYNVLGQDIKTESNLSSNRNYTVNLSMGNIYFYRLTRQNKVIKTGKIL